MNIKFMNIKFRRLTKALFLLATILISSCQEESVEISSYNESTQGNNLDVKFENLTYSEAISEKAFLELKSKFYIQDPEFDITKKIYFSNDKKNNSKTPLADFSELHPSIDVSVVRKITAPNYVSYTMRVNEPKNESSSFSNIVIQNSNGVQEIFTFRYFPSENPLNTERNFEGNYTMTRGICQFDELDCDGGPGEGGGSDDFVRICEDVIVMVPIGCGCGHMPWQNCEGCHGNFPRWELEMQEQCYWDYEGSVGTGGQNPGSGGNNTGGGGVGNPSGPEGNVITTPITEILPEGALETFMNFVNPSQQNSEWINDQLAENPQAIVSLWSLTAQSNNLETKILINELLNILRLENNVDNDALDFMIQAYLQNKMYNDVDADFLSSVDSYIKIDLTNQENIDPVVDYLITKIALITLLNPDFCEGLSDFECEINLLWEASKDVVHITLDGIGLIPVAGEAADLINGGLYTLEGDGVNATLSFASAIPVADWVATGSKYAIKIVDATQTAYSIGTKVKLTWKVLADGAIYFGSNSTCRRQLRKALGMGSNAIDARQAHYIIPLNLQTNTVIQKAAKSENAFHLNEILNGIPLDNAVNNGSHFDYDGKITQKFTLFLQNNPNPTPNECYDAVINIINDIRTAITNNPTTHINLLDF
ncbi:hypothetical protein [Leeuwenhoekiella marinoflava]|uniref:hypothetical protein n=1 Tax=Leeuwenhoekiella marinoflava TaxID=988 RepID=UPI003001CA93